LIIVKLKDSKVKLIGMKIDCGSKRALATVVVTKQQMQVIVKLLHRGQLIAVGGSGGKRMNKKFLVAC